MVILLACSVVIVSSQFVLMVLDMQKMPFVQWFVYCVKEAWKVAVFIIKYCKCERSEELEVLTKMIQVLMDKEKVILNLKVMRYMSHFWMAYIIACSIPRQVEALSRRSADWWSMCEEGGPLVLLMLNALFTVFPRCMTPRVIDILYVFSSLRFIILFLYTEDVMQMRYAAGNAFFARFVGSSLICNIRLALPVNLIVCGFCIFAYFRGSQQPSLLDETFPSHFADFVFMELAFTTGSCVIAWAYEYSAKRHNLEGRLLAQADATVQQLLSGMCDAVVILSSDLKIMGRAPKLANLLLRSATGKALAGLQFDELLLSTELDRFSMFLEQARNNVLDRPQSETLVSACEVRAQLPSDLTPALSMSFQLRDVTGSFFHTRLFCSCFLDLNEEISYIIGVCEQNNSAQSLPPHLSYPSRIPQTRTSQFETPRDEACSSSSGSSDLDGIAPLRFEALIVSIDVFSNGLRIVHSSTSFDHFVCTDTIGRSLLDFVVEHELLMSCVQTIVNNVVGGGREADSLDLQRVHVKPPDWSRGFVLRAQCSVIIPGVHCYDDPDFDESLYEQDENVLIAEVVFKHGHQISASKLSRDISKSHKPPSATQWSL
eukprot:TRINITY_DN73759_c0_g1_i1.p1 TRINITY_DN73759_c0_g1~~TRINITY_DN73759_c0_g1_i1.p1  ORF type:complete len:624 (-),score=88.18 TRINITY_DN73759_c0_g1_i1:255-2057(-)